MLKFVEENWGLAPLAARDRAASSIAAAFDFKQTAARRPILLSLERRPPSAQVVRTTLVYWAYSGAVVFPMLILLAGFGIRRLRR
jgi:phospholipase C